MKTNTQIMMGVLFLALSASCGEVYEQPRDGVTEQQDVVGKHDFKLLARLDLSGGRRVEFYQPEPGLVLISEAGKADGPPLLQSHPNLERLSPVQLHRVLAPQLKVPQALLTAEAEARRMKAQRRAAGLEPADYKPGHGEAKAAPAPGNSGHVAPPAADGVGSHQQALSSGQCSASWFNGAFCTGSGDWQACKLNWWNGYHSWCTGLWKFKNAVCADIGHVQLRITTTNGLGGTWSVMQGTYRWYRGYCGSSFWDVCDEFNMNSYVENASNNRFHYSSQCWFD